MVPTISYAHDVGGLQQPDCKRTSDIEFQGEVIKGENIYINKATQ